MRNENWTENAAEPGIGAHVLAGTPQSTLVVIANSRHAKIFMRHNRHFHFIEEMECDDRAISGLDNKTLGRGGAYGAGRHKYEPSMTESRQEQIGLAHNLACWLNKEFEQKKFESLVLVAAPAMLGEIRKALGKPVSNAIIAESNKQLIQVNDAQLAEELLKIIPGPDSE